MTPGRPPHSRTWQVLAHNWRLPPTPMWPGSPG